MLLRRLVVLLALAVCATPATQAQEVVAQDSGVTVVRAPRGGSIANLFLPGRAQLREGSRAKGMLFLTLGFAGVVTSSALQWTYQRKVDISNSYEADYASQVGALKPLREYEDAAGYLTRWDVYRRWQEAYASANDMRSARNIALWSTLGVFVLNAADVLFLGRKDGGGSGWRFEPETRLQAGQPVPVFRARRTF